MEKVRLRDVCIKDSSNIAQKDLENNEGDFPIYGASGFIKKVNFYKQDKEYIAIVKDGAGVGRAFKCPAKSSVIGTMQYILPKENVDIDFLAFAIEYMNLAKYCSGATIPHIYFKDYCKEWLPLPALEKQMRIAYILKCLTALINKRKQQLEKMDLLVKARFVEMFGDCKINPFNWPQVTVNDVCNSIIRGPFGSALKKDFFVKAGCNTYKVYEQKHAIKKSAHIGNYYIDSNKFNELKRFECKAGDILMSCSGTMGEFYQLPDDCESGIINQELCKFTINKKKILPMVFITYMQEIIGDLETKGSGIKNIAAVSYVKAMSINLPTMELQSQFADFVKQIDQAKLAVKKSLEKAEYLKSALMQKYFG